MEREKLNQILNEHKMWLSNTGGKYANLQYANLQYADLRGANLRDANLRDANLRDANLQYADLQYANGLYLNCPETGFFTAYKKAITADRSATLIVKLQIPEDAKRSSATGRKCRCDKAKVLEISDVSGIKTDFEEAHSNHDKSFVYRVGETVSVDNFDDDRWKECAAGIHFFITRQEAVDY